MKNEKVFCKSLSILLSEFDKSLNVFWYWKRWSNSIPWAEKKIKKIGVSHGEKSKILRNAIFESNFSHLDWNSLFYEREMSELQSERNRVGKRWEKRKSTKFSSKNSLAQKISSSYLKCLNRKFTNMIISHKKTVRKKGATNPKNGATLNRDY